MTLNLKGWQLPRSIWALGFVSLFMDISSEIVHGLLPVFLVVVLGSTVAAVGVLEGLAEGVVLLLKMLSGPMSDYFGKRKPLVVLGYSIGAISKPLFAMALTVPGVYAARILDRVGKGIRGAPRDAMVADLAPPELRGRAFGLRQSLDTVGAFLGPILAIVLMRCLDGDFRKVFWLATIPGLIAVSILLFGVQEETALAKPKPSDRRIKVEDIKKFPKAFWIVVGAGMLFHLARFSEAFLILRANDLGLTLTMAPLVLIVMNIVYSLSALPIGYLSDRFPREWFLGFGLFVLVLADLTLGLGNDLTSTFWGIGLWGLHLGLTQGTLAALVADTCDPDRRGTAYGLFNLFSAVSLLLASSIAGVLWDQKGANWTFLIGAGFSLISLIVLLLFPGIRKKTAVRNYR